MIPHDAKDEDVLASTQRVVEKILDFIMNKARQLGKSSYPSLHGRRCFKLFVQQTLRFHFDNIWIMSLIPVTVVVV